MSKTIEGVVWFKLEELADLGLKRETLVLYCRTGKIIASKIGREWFVSEPNLALFMKMKSNDVPKGEPPKGPTANDK